MMAGRELPEIILEDLEEEDEDFSSEDEKHANNLNTIPTFTITKEPPPKPARSPSPSMLSIGSKTDFVEPKIDDSSMENMMKLATLNEGQSRFGTTCKFLNRQTMTEYTVTQWNVEEMQAKQISSICSQLDNIASLRQQRIARFYGYHCSSSTITMFRMFVPSGTVADKLKRGPLTEHVATKYFKQVLEALKHLHDKHIVHGNVKTTNILVTLSNDIQLADMALTYSPHPEVHRRRTLFFCAPELFRDRLSIDRTTPASDVWAAGCALVSMVTRFPPFKDHFITLSTDQVYERLLLAHMPDSSQPLSFRSETLIPTSSRKLADMVDAALVPSPSVRSTAAMMLETFFGIVSVRSSITQRISDGSLNYSQRKSTVMNHDDLYNDAPMPIYSEMPEKQSLLSVISSGDDQAPLFDYIRWYISRILIFGSLLLKWIGMVLLAALSLAMVAGSVFFAIFIIYNGIGVVCQCQLNEGFIVLIALILLPIIILLTTLCCNNSCEKYKQAVEEGQLEKCRYVTPQPEDDVILCGIIVVDGKKEQRKHSVKRKNASPEENDPTAASNLPKTAFVRGVARIA